MRFLGILLILLVSLPDVHCALKKVDVPEGSIVEGKPTVETYLSTYDHLEQHFGVLCNQHRERFGQDPLLIEAGEIAAQAEELYLLAEYGDAQEMLQQAIDLLQGRQKVEGTHP